MRIGELSERTGVSVRMLRFYEAAGLLAPGRTANGYRTYGVADATTVERIRLLGAAGLTLDAIRELLPCVRSDEPTFEACDKLRTLMLRQLHRIDGKIERLGRSRALLAGFVSGVEALPTREPAP